jgi:hypothetical protein
MSPSSKTIASLPHFDPIFTSRQPRRTYAGRPSVQLLFSGTDYRLAQMVYANNLHLVLHFLKGNPKMGNETLIVSDEKKGYHLRKTLTSNKGDTPMKRSVVITSLSQAYEVI